MTRLLRRFAPRNDGKRRLAMTQGKRARNDEIASSSAIGGLLAMTQKGRSLGLAMGQGKVRAILPLNKPGLSELHADTEAFLHRLFYPH
jgi:hypothetical protein